MRILMVCLGNICRSPLAEGIMQQKALENGLNWTVDSAGIGGWHRGEAPDRRSVKVAQRFGVDISRQRARQFSAADFEQFDRIFAMDMDNLRDIRRQAKNADDRDKASLISAYAWPGQDKEVPDPYYGDEQGFEAVFQMLDRACEQFIQAYLREKL